MLGYFVVENMNQNYKKKKNLNKWLSTKTYLHPPGLNPRLVAELNQSHQHGQPESTNQNVEYSGYITETESTRLVLSSQGFRFRERQSWC